MAENIDETTAARLASAQPKVQQFEQIQAALKKAVESGVVADPQRSDPAPGRYVAFLSPVEKNTRFLIKGGKVVSFPDKDSPRGQKEVGRDGDLWVEFHDGIGIFDTEDAADRARIEWCAANPAICRDVSDPMTEAWAELKQGQQPLAWRDAVIARSMDIDAALRGDPSGYARAGSQADRARKQVAEANA